MRHLFLLALVGCASGTPVVRWTSAGIGVGERIEIKSSGDGSYVSLVNGVEQKNERVVLTHDQVEEIDELFRSKGACQLAHDPAYTPVADEGQTTLELTFPGQTCKVVLFNLEWERGNAQAISETMRSMRPLRMQQQQPNRMQRQVPPSRH
jgi:hypothetical protein